MDDFSLPASDPNNPNARLMTPEQIAKQQALAEALTKSGNDYSPIASPWQGAARLGDALAGAIGSYKSAQAQNALGLHQKAIADYLGGGGSTPAPAPQGVNAPLAAALGPSAPSAKPPNLALASALGAPEVRSGPTPSPSAVAVGSNNNPGNLIDNQWTEGLPGFAGAKGRFASFETPEAGIAAMQRNLASYAHQGVNTIAGLTAKWAPAGDGANNPAAYAATVAAGLGIGPNDPVNLADPAVQQRLVPLMARVEQGAGAPTVQAFNGQPAPAPASAAIANASPQGDMMPPARPSAPVTTSALAPPADQGPSPYLPPAPSSASAPAPPSPQATSQLALAMNAPQPNAAGAGAPVAAGPQGAGAPAPPPVAPQGAHPDLRKLYQIMADPYASPQMQQVASHLIETMTPGKPTWGVVSKDAFGQEQYGWIPNNPAAAPGTPGAAPGGYAAPGAAATGGAPNDLHGAAFLATVPPQIAPLVQAVAEGRMSPASLSSRGPIAGPVMRAVAQYDPTFDAGDTEARFATRKNFSSGNIAASITAGNTALLHLKELSDMTENGSTTHGWPNLSGGTSGDNPMVNGIRNSVGDLLGSNMGDKPYDAIASKFVSEATKLYLGAEGTQGGRDADLATMKPDMSREQLRAVYTANTKAVASKIAELQSQWKRVMGPAAGEYPLMSSGTKDAVTAINSRDPSYKAEGGAPAGSTVATPAPPITTKADYDALPKGTRFTAPDGSVRVKP